VAPPLDENNKEIWRGGPKPTTPISSGKISRNVAGDGVKIAR